MSCSMLGVIVDRTTLRLKRGLELRLVYSREGDVGVEIGGILTPLLSMTLPLEGLDDLDPRTVAEAICCTMRTSLLETVFNLVTALALIVGSALGIREAILVGVAGMIIAVLQALARVAYSRRPCQPPREAILVGEHLKGLAREALYASSDCSSGCGRMLAYGGNVYRLISVATGNDRVEVRLRPL